VATSKRVVLVAEDVAFVEGDRVLMFDGSLYVDDVKTPLYVTMKAATVIRHYGRKKIPGCDWSWDEPSLIDVRFDHDGRLSRGHFTGGVSRL